MQVQGGEEPVRPARRRRPAFRVAARGALVASFALLAALPALAQETPAGTTAPRAPASPRGAASQPPVPPEAGEAVERAVERYEALLAQELEQRVGPADNWDISIPPAPLADLRAGKLPPVTARAVNVRLPGGEVIAELELQMTGLEVDTERAALVRAGDVTLTAEMQPEDLARTIDLWAGKKLRRVRIRLRNEKVLIRAQIRALGTWLTFRKRGHPEIRDNAVYVTTQRVQIAGLTVPIRFVRRLERRINPILDPEELRVPVRILVFGPVGETLVARLEVEVDGELEPPSSGTLAERLVERRDRFSGPRGSRRGRPGPGN